MADDNDDIPEGRSLGPIDRSPVADAVARSRMAVGDVTVSATFELVVVDNPSQADTVTCCMRVSMSPPEAHSDVVMALVAGIRAWARTVSTDVPEIANGRKINPIDPVEE